MTKEDSAKILAVKYMLDYNTFRNNDRLKEDLIAISRRYQFVEGEDAGFTALFERYCRDFDNGIPRWAKLIMAEKYSINI